MMFQASPQLRWWVLLFSLSLLQVGVSAQDPQPKDSSRLRDEESRDFYKKWLDEDVVYIITPEEKYVFQKLSTEEEKDRFIEQFWLRRDPDPRTTENEFKLEHYRRIAFANERFAAGYPGWLTDRGRIYILYGEPDQMTNHSAGETYDRPLWEGGGTTTTYPYSVWRYRHIEGVGDDIELEFVDSTLSGEYRLAVSPDEKDALFASGVGGATLLEMLGASTRQERGTSQQQLGYERERDSPFIRFETYANVLSPAEIRYNDLKEQVEVNTQFNDLPFQVRVDHVKLNDRQDLALVSVMVAHENLQFSEENGSVAARLAIYGAVSSLGRRVVHEFDDDLESRIESASGERRDFVYQKILPIDVQGKYKLSLVVKDLASEKIGVLQTVIDTPPYPPGKLSSSTLILSDSIQSVGGTVSPTDMFVIGDLKVVPKLEGDFLRSGPLGVYLQIYGNEIDQNTGAPALDVTYRILDDSETRFEITDSEGQSVRYYSDTRAVLVRAFRLKNLEPGQYRVQVQVRDRINGESVSVESLFSVVE